MPSDQHSIVVDSDHFRQETPCRLPIEAFNQVAARDHDQRGLLSFQRLKVPTTKTELTRQDSNLHHLQRPRPTIRVTSRRLWRLAPTWITGQPHTSVTTSERYPCHIRDQGAGLRIGKRSAIDTAVAGLLSQLNPGIPVRAGAPASPPLTSDAETISIAADLQSIGSPSSCHSIVLRLTSNQFHSVRNASSLRVVSLIRFVTSPATAPEQQSWPRGFPGISR